MANIATLTAKLEADIHDFEADMRRVNRRLDQVEGGAKKAGGAFKGLGKFIGGLGFALAAKKVGDFAAEVTMLAVDAEEAASAFKTTFGPAVDDAQRFVDEFANKAGFAEHELQQLMATTGNIIQGLGGTEQASSALSQEMATLAGDVASFSNAAGGAPAVLKALQSALTGEREALKTYGIVISEADVQTEAFRITGKKTAAELTRMEKAQATLNIATQRAGKAVGDLDRTSDSAANTMRRVQARITELKTAAGKELLPMFEQLLPVIEKVVLTLGPKLVAAVGDAAIAITGLMGIFDDDTRQLHKFLKVQKQVNLSLEEGWPATTAFSMGLRRMRDDGIDTADNIDTLRRSLNLTDSELVQNIRNHRILTGETGLYETSMKGAIQRMHEQSTIGKTLKTVLDRLRSGTDDNTEAQKDLEKQVGLTTTQIEGLTSAMLANVSPVFNAIRSYENMQEVMADTESSALDQAEAILEAAAAFGSLSDAQVTDAIRAIATALEISNGQAAALLANAGLIDGRQLSMDIVIDYMFNQIGPGIQFGAGAGAAFGASPPVIRDPFEDLPHELLGLAKGGVVPGPIGAPQLAVVHGGETVTPPGQQGGGTIVIELDGRQLWTAVKRYAVDDQIRNRGTGLN